MSATPQSVDLTVLGPDEAWPRRVGIVMPARGHDYHETGHILSQVVRELGCDVQFMRDGDRSLLDYEMLILFGKCSAFERSARLLAAHSAQRPATLLWHVEPLLPEKIPETAERTCRLLGKCDWGRWPRPLRKVMATIPGSVLVRDTARRVLSTRLKRLCDWDNEPRHSQVHARQWFHAAQHYSWFQQWHSNRWCDLVAVSTPARHEVLTRMGIRSAYAPIGYHPLWGGDLGLKRDIDVLFLGRVRRTSRQVILSRLCSQLKQHDVELTVVDRNCFGQDRTELLNRTRVILDIVQNSWEMPVMRLLTSMACGAMVVSNWTSDPHPFRPEHLVRAGSHRLADAVLRYLRAEPDRRRIAEAAQQYVTSELLWHKTVRRLLHLCRRQTPPVTGVMI